MCIKNDEIKSIVNKRRISHLVHFTRVENLHSILKYGIVSREISVKKNIPILTTDDNRWDGHLDFISTSISFPNYKMFYPKRINLSGTWVVICISPKVLWKHQCNFFEHNAAYSSMTTRTNNSSANDFELMFNNSQEYKGTRVNRENLKLNNNETTDPQAEVMVKDVIDPKYIQSICIQRRNVPTINTQQLDNQNIKLYHYPNFFYPRNDYGFWRI